MGQEDRLKRQIDQLAKALANILSRLTGADSQANVLDAVDLVNTKLKNELNLNLDELTEVTDEELIAQLTHTYGLNNTHFTLLADIIYEAAKSLNIADETRSRKLFGKALVLYKHLAATEKNYSLHWHNRIAEIASA
jgi:radical SAM superfamily enzyme YgiQ (UPF0313 family)